jgi:hypothetical protein
MDPTFRKIALIAAALGLLLSLFLALRPDDDDEQDAAPTTTAPTTTAPATTEPPATTEAPPTTTEPPPPPPNRVTIRLRVVGGQPVPGIRRAKVKQGRQVTIVTTADVSDHIHLHGYDLTADVAPGSPARIRFRATIPGRFEVELEERGIQIADLSVTP